VFNLAAPLRALFVALAGAGLAWLSFNHLVWLAAVIAVVVLAVGWLLDRVGERSLPKHPVRAVRLLELWSLVPLMLGAVAAAAVVVVTVALTVPDSTSTDTKETVGALATAVTTFLTSVFVNSAGDKDDSTLSDHIQATFERHYGKGPAAQPDPKVHYFGAETAGLRWVFSGEYGGISGWGRPARLTRAKGIAAELKSGASNA
jgi:hypothetical protein